MLMQKAEQQYQYPTLHLNLLLYLGIGQGYDDMIRFNRERFVESIFNNESLLDSYRGTQASVPNENYRVPGIEEANEGKETHKSIKQ